MEAPDQMEQTYIIAEVGVNHNGQLDLALELLEKSARAGADAVKFQTFKAENLVTQNAAKAAYQIENTQNDGSQFAMLKSLELSEAEHVTLLQKSKTLGVNFLSTPFDRDSLEFLQKLQLSQLKVSSGDLTNAPFLLQIGATKKNIIISGGMATLGDIELALGALSFGGLNGASARPASLQDLIDCYLSDAGQQFCHDHISLLHCSTEYPSPPEVINLRVMDTLRLAFPSLTIGYSDHSEGISIPVAAVARGARIIEKHVTLDRNLAGPDHIASIEVEKFATMVAHIREVEKCLGSSQKCPHPVELENRTAARKSLVASAKIQNGDLFTEANLEIKRPGNGMPPAMYWTYLGKPAKKAYQVGELID